VSSQVETNGISPCLVVPLHSILTHCSAALSQAAHETRSETDPLPRNLQAAMNRVDVHVHFFLRVTNPEAVGITHQVDVGDLLGLRDRVVALHEEVGRSLCCEEGFLQKTMLNASKEECEGRLQRAAERISELSNVLRGAIL
jgi:hypothetical protein